MLKQFQLYVKSNMTLVYQSLISIVAIHFPQYFFLLQRFDISKSSQLSNGRLSLPGFSCTHQESIVAVNPSSTMKPEGRVKIFSGSANLLLAQEIASYMGMELGKINIKRFADGEVYVQLQESVRGCHVFLVQPTCPPANENLMELLIMIDACRRASARSITAIIPYFGYGRADRKVNKLNAIVFFGIPLSIPSKDLVVVSPDVGGVARARGFAKRLSDAPLAIVDKRRQGHNISEVMNLIGDVKGKVAVLVDDMIDTAGKLL
ncbi:hypothetical protein GW17_00026946 [Ensete ventricosum]|uniref:ribose-phosphate diphosphokinase n=1 Tax=Ensete ventricosum TaxID=4639 RepID=A0A444EGQ7_ENSVE|nr:hypothetical protein B296_00044683 [Ensete ventricosum]RWW09568.1 hypothetical protein GW17_00026946 [Ensete ventricosum]RZR70832.1 hypothetical protein BHM03_00001844 [Ensete ventricosum]